MNTECIRKNRSDILKTLKPWTDASITTQTYRSQYDGYKSIVGVNPDSTTETYFALKTELLHPRWAGVPIYMEAGKRMHEARKEIILTLFTYRPPKLITYELNRKGVVIEKTLYPYVGLESFWIADHHEFVEPKLIIKSTKVVMPYIIIPLIDVDPEDVHDILRTVIAEEEHHEPLAHKLMEYLGF